MTPKRAKRRSVADFRAQISMRFPREFRRPIKFALLRPAPIFVAEKDRPREDDLFDPSSLRHYAMRHTCTRTGTGKQRVKLTSALVIQGFSVMYSLGVDLSDDDDDTERADFLFQK